MTTTHLNRRGTRWSIHLYGFKVNGIQPINDLENPPKGPFWTKKASSPFPVLPFVKAYYHYF